MRQLCLPYVFGAPVEGEEAAVGPVAVKSPRGSGPTAFPPWPQAPETTDREERQVSPCELCEPLLYFLLFLGFLPSCPPRDQGLLPLWVPKQVLVAHPAFLPSMDPLLVNPHYLLSAPNTKKRLLPRITSGRIWQGLRSISYQVTHSYHRNEKSQQKPRNGTLT